MDSASTPQTVAQAVQAATQQQSQQLSAPSPPVQAPAAGSSSIDNLTCQWSGCGERCDTAESLYVSIADISESQETRAWLAFATPDTY